MLGEYATDMIRLIVTLILIGFGAVIGIQELSNRKAIADIDNIMVEFKADVESEGTFNDKKRLELQQQLEEVSNNIKIEEIIEDKEESTVTIHVQVIAKNRFGNTSVMDNKYITIENVDTQ